MEGAYLGKYGDALRRLQALEAVQSGQPVGPMGPQPVTGAFQTQGLPSRLDPRYAPDPSMPAFEQAGAGPQLPPGAFEQGQLAQPSIVSDDPARGGISGNLPKPQQSVRQVVEGLDPKERTELRAGIKEQVGRSVNELYDEFVRTGEIAPPVERKPRAKEKLSTVAEALFRYMSNVGQGMNPGAASALATLETQGRRGALEQTEIDEENARAEQRRAEVQGVLSSRAAQATKKAETEDERTYKTGREEDAQTHALDLQRQQDAAALARTQVSSKGARNVQTSILEDGTVMERDPETGLWRAARSVQPVTKKGRRGVTTTVEQETPLKVPPKTQTGQVTNASRQRMMDDAIKAIQKDTLQMARIRAAVGDDPETIASEIADRARMIVEESLAATGTLGAYGDNPLD